MAYAISLLQSMCSGTLVCCCYPTCYRILYAQLANKQAVSAKREDMALTMQAISVLTHVQVRFMSIIVCSVHTDRAAIMNICSQHVVASRLVNACVSSYQ
jgi:hypothetical protein